MTDEFKIQIPKFDTTNWFNNSGFSVSNPFVNINSNVFEGYYQNTNTFCFDTFNFNSYIPSNSIFMGNFTNFYSSNFDFNFSSLASFMPKINFDFSGIFSKNNSISCTYPQVTPLAGAAKLFETPKLTKPETVTNKNNVKVENISSKEVTINGTTVHKLGGANLNDLQPDLKDSLVKLTKLADQHGYKLVVSDGHRSISEQADLKRRKPSLAATPGKSAHNYGCAIDIALYEKSTSKQVDITKLPWFYNYAKDTLGLAWGQDWKNHIKESWHFERKDWNKAGSDVYLAYCKQNGITPESV